MSRKIYFLACMLSFCLMANPMYSQADFYENYFRDSVSFVFDGMDKIRQADIFTTHKAQFGLGVHDEMIMTNNVVTEDGKLTTKYIMKHKGIPVEGSMMNIIGDKGIVLYANGFLRTGLDVDNVNIISEQDAIDAAIDYIGATKYIWQDSTLRAELISEGIDPDSALYPQYAELLITKKRGEEYEHTAANYELCYKVKIHSLEPEIVVKNVYVNANTGEVFTLEDAFVHDYSTSGTVHTWYNGTHNNMRTRSCSSCFNFWLHDVERNIFTTKYNNYYYAKNAHNKDNNNVWSEDDTKTAATAHWSIQRTWEYYLNRHGRWGSNYQGRRVHVKTKTNVFGNNSNAGFLLENNVDNIVLAPDGSYPVYNLGQPGYSIATFDIMAHEYTHAMVRSSSELGQLGDLEAKALDEGYSDIFGVLIERYTLNYMDWKWAEATGWLTRHFNNPEDDVPYKSPSIYLGPYWHLPDVHSAGGVLRKWFYLISEGGTFNGKTVAPLGLNTAESIAYITFNWWLWSNVKYKEMAKQTIAATIAHYGRCSKEHLQVHNAFIAVGLIPNSIPMCGVEICCLSVVDVATVTPPGGAVAEWTANIQEDIADTGTYTWHIPDGWTAMTEGNQLTLFDHTDNSSKTLAVSYTVDGNVYTDSMVIHFSDEEWVPTDNMPMEPASKPFENRLVAESNLVIYPNPADMKVTISIPEFKDNATIAVYNIAGTLIKEIAAEYGNVEIATSDLTNGLYLIKVVSGDKVYHQKLTITH